MQIDFSLAKRLLLPALSLALSGYFNTSASAQTVEQVVVTGGDDVTSAYGAPGGLSRSRFAPLTTAYVLQLRADRSFCRGRRHRARHRAQAQTRRRGARLGQILLHRFRSNGGKNT